MKFLNFKTKSSRNFKCLCYPQNIVYKEAVRRNKFDEFILVIKSLQKVPHKESLGCGLKFVSMKIEEHYKSEATRYKKLSNRLIGSQAIALAQYSYRLIDALKVNNESDSQIIKRLVLAKICQYLRNIGALINQVNVKDGYPVDVRKACQMYFNLFSLFFAESCQSTVWTLGYIVPHFAEVLFNDYGKGYGIISMQGKEAKHSALKQELKSSTNRSTSEDDTNKWHQIMRSSYVHTFYLPYHFPITSGYHSHYQSRVPSFDS